MSKDLLIKIEQVIKEEDQELEEFFANMENSELLVAAVKDLEKRIAKLLRSQRAQLVKLINNHLTKADEEVHPLTLAALLRTQIQQWFENNEFAEKLSDIMEKWFNKTIPEIANNIMDSIDKDVVFNQLTQRTVTWIQEWSKDLGELMNLSSHKAVEKLFVDKLENGTTIPQLIRDLKELPEFDYNRARATAITEALTASSVADQESYVQSPAVIGKKWLHSGGKAIKPRPAHVALNGTVVGVEEFFDVNGHQAFGPRDTSLPASERIFCHCTTVPVVDEEILGLSAEEKEAIRREVLEELGQDPGENFF